MTIFKKENGKTIAITTQKCVKCKKVISDSLFRQFCNKDGRIEWSKKCILCEWQEATS